MGAIAHAELFEDGVHMRLGRARGEAQPGGEEVEGDGDCVIVLPSIPSIVRSQEMSRVPGFQPTPKASVPSAAIQAMVLGRVMRT